ncbi:MAG: hypothetical protein IJG36_01320 [Synergistaceae bacterium]|nr:hypothetical protein [Synergistaceae bacterium]
MDVEAYVTSLPVSDAEKNRTRKDLNAFKELLASHGRTFPEECDYQEYRTMKSATDKNPKTPADRIRRIKKYFDTLQKGEVQMTIPETTATENTVIIPAQPDETSVPASEEPEALSTLEAEEKKSPRMGAPRKSSELRDKKITIYITASLEEDVKDLARIDGRTTPDYIFRLIERESEKRATDLASIREMRQRNA